MKILIVEDNPQMRQLIRAVVVDLADVVTECADGRRRSRHIRRSS
jgi:CheY-like chemotaxis protein